MRSGSSGLLESKILSNEKAPCGSHTPRTYPSDTITVRCDQCGREGRYRRTTLTKQFGPDEPMPDILNAITENCDSQRKDVVHLNGERHGRVLEKVCFLAR